MKEKKQTASWRRNFKGKKAKELVEEFRKASPKDEMKCRKGRTCISISESLRSKLQHTKRKNETYDQLIERLLK